MTRFRTWHDLPQQDTPVDAAGLHDLEDRIGGFTVTNVQSLKQGGGAKGDGATLDDTPIAAAITQAKSNGDWVFWPSGVYKVAGNIADFWSVRHFGPGIVNRATTFFPVQPGPQDTNRVYAAPTGSPTNDGLTSGFARPLDVALLGLDNFGPALTGTWTLQLLAGTYGGLVDTTTAKVIGTVNTGFSASPSTILVDKTSSGTFASTGGIQIDGEAFTYTGTTGETSTQVTLTGVLAGRGGTTPSGHSAGANIYSRAGYTLPDGLMAMDRLLVLGASVGGHPNVPTTVFDVNGLAYGLRLNTNAYAQVQDVKGVNADLLIADTACSFLAGPNSNIIWKNVHSTGNGAFAGINSSEADRAFISGGIINGNHQDGYRFYGGCIYTMGYQASTLAQGPQITGATSAAILGQGSSYGDIFYTTMDANRVGVNLLVNSRARINNSSLTNHTVAAAKGEQGSQVNLFQAGNNNTLSGNAADLILTGNSTEITLHSDYDAQTEVRPYRDTTPVTVTGTTSQTILKATTFTVPTWIAGKKMRVRCSGSMTGPNTKTLGVYLNSTPLATLTTPSGAAGSYELECHLHFTSTTAVRFTINLVRDGTTTQVLDSTQTFSALTGTQVIRSYATLADASAAVTQSTIEVYAL